MNERKLDGLGSGHLNDKSGPVKKKRRTNNTYVALDLETTGLVPNVDAIVEIGAVKFRNERVLDTFQTLVNPYRELPRFVQRLTGIEQKSLDKAPPFAAVSQDFIDFVGTLPVVGHNIAFDLAFLSKHGIPLNNESYDTWDLVSVLLPGNLEYSLQKLAADVGYVPSKAHRALADAQATHKVFVAMAAIAQRLEPEIGAGLQRLFLKANWPLATLFAPADSGNSVQKPTHWLENVDVRSLGDRTGKAHRRLKPAKEKHDLDAENILSWLSPGGLFSTTYPGYEQRQEQLDMVRIVAGAFNRGDHLMVEGGTGVGKSLAYLLPAMLYARENGTTVVVSTATINLQEQLLHKDIPALAKLFEEAKITSPGEIRAVPLKGRANYLCLRRWNNLANVDNLSQDDARLLGKTLVWLQDGSDGDKAEINLAGRDAVSWNRVSAAEKGQCPGLKGAGSCFLRAARDRAEGAHLVIVNHALLLSDVAMGGGLLPEYKHLIVDEAHHLEEEATRQLGFAVSENILRDRLDDLSRLISEIRLFARGSLSNAQIHAVDSQVEELSPLWETRMKNHWNNLWSLSSKFMSSHRDENGGQQDVRITRSTRAQPAWSDIEIAWENVNSSLQSGTSLVDRLKNFLDTLPSNGIVDIKTVSGDMDTWQQDLIELQERLRTVFGGHGDESRIEWLERFDERGSKGSSITLRSAPLNVGGELNERLFSKKETVVLTSATLTSGGSFSYMRERLGLSEGEELIIGSPFDYSRSALLLLPEDIPLPDQWGHQEASGNLLVELGKALNGHSLVLFTSYSALKATARLIREPLESSGVIVFAQGEDGSPRQIMRRFAEDPRGVILGTSSFWEGVDLSGGVLKALVLAKLPFNVPTEPIFAARAAQYEDSFNQYALPQTVLRFRQGFGRLIRGSEDTGSIIVLDRRILARSYGKVLLDSLPPCTVKSVPLASIPEIAADWVKTRP